MSELYLIYHKVRGEPAFDIAIKLQIGDEEGWIIPTSGHRAYPYDYIALDELCIMSIGKYNEEYHNLSEHFKVCPPNWPDHYSASPAPKGQGLLAPGSLLERLGLLRKMTIRRR